ncbi:hypothetical protein BDV96DRAFT_594898 [Lophiotrema nucula]|uniref:Uncharacterized protein n=1 Tax=Lophiotrema nucula TaxID=690887 RepID=A0A6A5ZLF7_9PLEO|nr:hypothetical protein BDV96DRAFT_594898 [Lophiotrema nucula]
MAPKPVDVQPATQTNTKTEPQESRWNTATIVSLSIFAFVIVAFGITVFAFWWHRRAERMKLPPEARPVSYHPFRTASSKQKEGLLANAAPSPEDDKRSMFSRDSRASLSLYVDAEHHELNKRASMETVSLIPLHITPVDEVHDPFERADSNGTGISGISRSTTATSTDSLGLSTITVPGGEDDLGVRKTRQRSSSALSARYYETTPVVPHPQVPKIVHTPSD